MIRQLDFKKKKRHWWQMFSPVDELRIFTTILSYLRREKNLPQHGALSAWRYLSGPGFPKNKKFHVKIPYLKGQCHEIFCFWFFSWISFPQAPEYTLRAVSNFFRKFTEIFAAQGWPPGINDTSGKFATGVSDTGGKIAAGSNDTGGKFATGTNDTSGKFCHQFH